MLLMRSGRLCPQGHQAGRPCKALVRSYMVASVQQLLGHGAHWSGEALLPMGREDFAWESSCLSSVCSLRIEYALADWILNMDISS